MYELWLSQYRLSVKPSSIALAQRFCKIHILPVFSKLKLNKITVAFCQKQVNIWHGKYKRYGLLEKTNCSDF
ncbi:N-terminal phage integrase SAM-like domain-containing protein [Carnobacterium divergens]|nr:N-terminal phage integrase SAM-like domain-containing protein [Carnobacterium divergens]MDO0874408.1 N-terminal phage integrase SAM-like domain-containing protein [Carnobacterium divergens]